MGPGVQARLDTEPIIFRPIQGFTRQVSVGRTEGSNYTASWFDPSPAYPLEYILRVLITWKGMQGSWEQQTKELLSLEWQGEEMPWPGEGATSAEDLLKGNPGGALLLCLLPCCVAAPVHRGNLDRTPLSSYRLSRKKSSQ